MFAVPKAARCFLQRQNKCFSLRKSRLQRELVAFSLMSVGLLMCRVPPSYTNSTCFSPRQPADTTISGTDGTRFCFSVWVFAAVANLPSGRARGRYAVCPDGFVSGGSDPPGQYRPGCDAVLAETFVSCLRLSKRDEQGTREDVKT